MSPSRPARVPLTQVVAITTPYRRSVRAETGPTSESLLDGYVPTERSLDLLGRMVSASVAAPRVRSWSMTGPYGSGKSSFLAFVSALYASGTDPRHRVALRTLAEYSPLLHDELLTFRRNFGTDARGHIVAVATAGKESAERAVARALLAGAEQYWSSKGRKPAVLHELRAWIERGVSDASDLLGFVTELEHHAPILLAIDEFGKTMEYAAENPTSGDPYVLQLIAEHFNAADKVPSVVMVSQHLAIADYAEGLSEASKREWAKVGGRFEDVLFAGSIDQALPLIRGHLSRHVKDPVIEDRIQEWGSSVGSLLRDTRSGYMRRIAESSADYYPLHPLVVAIAPSLSQRFSQGDRSLHAWLAGGEPHSVAEFLARTVVDQSDPLPVYGPDDLFDHFFMRSAGTRVTGRYDSRLVEMVDRIRESSGLGVLELWLLKTVALLNLADPQTELSPTKEALYLAAQAQGIAGIGSIDEALSALQDGGYLVYRQFADEFRVWRGSDIDIESELVSAREQTAGVDLVTRLNQVAPPAASVAQRHGHQTGTFRFFRALYSAASASAAVEETAGGCDGLLVLSLAKSAKGMEAASHTSDGRPIVVGWSPDAGSLEAVAAEVSALEFVAATRAVQDDAVARAEVRERHAMAVAELGQRIRQAFNPSRADLRWFALGGEVSVKGAKALSALLSDVCDSAYCSHLPLRNEILNRIQLTSQGAKARRELMDHMLADSADECVGISGFGPERSMYESLLRELGLHVQQNGQRWALQVPTPESPAWPVWRAIHEFVAGSSGSPRPLSALFDELVRPPYGVREPVAPVLVLLYLLLHPEDVALYQDGTFEPQISSPLLERLVKAPDRFAVRRVLDAGARSSVLTALRTALGDPSRPDGVRNASVLQALKPVIGTIRGLSDHALHTRRLSKAAIGVRAAVMSARELDELVFVGLPQELGLDAFALDDKPDAERARRYAQGLAKALRELSDADEQLLRDVESQLRDAFGVAPSAEVRVHLRERSRRMEGRVIDSRLSAFALYASDSRLDERGWLEALALSLTDKPPSTWRDSDLEVFSARLAELAGLFFRVEALCCSVDAAGRSDGFLARRLAVTKPDGSELSRVVWAEEAEIQEIRREAETLIGRLRTAQSSRKLEILIAVLAEDLLAEKESSSEVRNAESKGVQDDKPNSAIG